jgi:hypothetical protein
MTRGAADRGEYRQAAGVVRRTNGFRNDAGLAVLPDWPARGDRVTRGRASGPGGFLLCQRATNNSGQ